MTAIFKKLQDIVCSIYDSIQILLLSFDLNTSLINLCVHLRCLVAEFAILEVDLCQRNCLGGNAMQRSPAKARVAFILKRREVLGFIGATAAASLTGCLRGPSASGESTDTIAQTPVQPDPSNPTAGAAINSTELPACIVTPEQTEGPYFVDQQLNRSDIRSGQEGVPLQLTLRVFNINGNRCSAAVGAIVDVWHCNALGIYSGVQDNVERFDTSGQNFLRGSQVTDENGTVRFTTIYPGWYPGRTAHIHFKVRTQPTPNQGFEFTSQLYFDDSITDQVFDQEPYASKGPRSATNARDGIYRDGGELLTLKLSEVDQGFATTFDIGIYTTEAS